MPFNEFTVLTSTRFFVIIIIIIIFIIVTVVTIIIITIIIIIIKMALCILSLNPVVNVAHIIISHTQQGYNKVLPG